MHAINMTQKMGSGRQKWRHLPSCLTSFVPRTWKAKGLLSSTSNVSRSTFRLKSHPMSYLLKTMAWRGSLKGPGRVSSLQKNTNQAVCSK